MALQRPTKGGLCLKLNPKASVFVPDTHKCVRKVVMHFLRLHALDLCDFVEAASGGMRLEPRRFDNGCFWMNENDLHLHLLVDADDTFDIHEIKRSNLYKRFQDFLIELSIIDRLDTFVNVIEYPHVSKLGIGFTIHCGE